MWGFLWKYKKAQSVTSQWLVALTTLVLQLCFLRLCFSSLSISLCVPPLFFFFFFFFVVFFFFFFRRCVAPRRWRVGGRSWSGSCPGSWAEGWPIPSPGPTCTLWAQTRRGPAPAWRWCYWFAGEDKTNVTEHIHTADSDQYHSHMHTIKGPVCKIQEVESAEM